MEFIETSIFTKLIKGLMNDDNYAALQHYLVLCPQAGKVISGSGGLRKIRWQGHQRGKRGGVRIIYHPTQNAPCGSTGMNGIYK